MEILNLRINNELIFVTFYWQILLKLFVNNIVREAVVHLAGALRCHIAQVEIIGVLRV